MVGLFMLSQLQKLLTIAKHTDSSVPFGRINVIFAGDFLQFSPVLDMALYSDVLTSSSDECIVNGKRKYVKKIQGERQVQCRVGRALWLQVSSVVLLKKQMRTDDSALLAMQSRIRFGNGTAEDHQALRTRIVKPLNELRSLNDPEWKKAAMLVCRNELRTKLNNMSAVCMAKENNEQLVVCVAKDTVHGDQVDKHRLVEFLLNLPDNKTEGLPGYLPLVRGEIRR